MRKEQIIKQIEEEKLVVILRALDGEKLIKTVEAMYQGGIRAIEITFDQSGKISDKKTVQNIKMIAELYEGKILVGAGTVMTLPQLEEAVKAGAKFIISPDSCEEIIKRSCELGVVSMPGAYTPTEAANAHRWGADFVKLFPNSQGGLSYLKALIAPLSHIKFISVGGVDITNVADYIKAGAVGVGIATGIANKKMIADGDYEGIRLLAERFVKAIKECNQ